MPTKPTEELTVLVFKDNDVSRSFQVSLGWISRFGFAVGALTVAALLGSFFALKFYRVAIKSDPSHVRDIEQQLSDLKAANQGLESKISAAATVAASSIAGPVAAAPGVNPLPAPTVTVTVTPSAATPAAANAPAPTANGGTFPFSGLPRKTENLSANAAKLPVTFSPVHSSWSGHAFKVEFNIQYVATDHGSQQGRIIVLARGPNALLAYPENILDRAGAESLIDPHQGEYFSVSRFREVKAEFPEARGAGILDVEVMILNLEGQIIFYEKVAASPGPADARKSAAPRPSSTAAVTPGSASTANAAVVTPGMAAAANAAAAKAMGA